MRTEVRRFSRLGMVALLVSAAPVVAQDYAVVDTGQQACFDDTGYEAACPAEGAAFSGQDAQYAGHPPTYRLSADGRTVYDVNTRLTWQRSPDTDRDGDIDAADKLNWSALQSYPETLNAEKFGGYDDWRLPTIKELYSLIDFRGTDPSGCDSAAQCPSIRPFIDTDYFDFGYGDTVAGERLIDAQYWSGTTYVSTTMGGDATVFGVNFADGRIKGYPRDTGPGGQPFTQFVRCVRGNPDYGINDFVDNGDGTVTDVGTGLVWQQDDDGQGRDWEQALAYGEDLTLAGCEDWRLPNAKELQSIVDYTRSPDTSGSAAIDPVFDAPLISVEGGETDYPFYWTSTTHANWTQVPGRWAAYVCFGEALGWMRVPYPPGTYVLQDVHGAGAQRSDPKSGNPADWPYGNGPQGDVVRVYNHVRAVRGEAIGACEIRAEQADITRVRFYPTCPAQTVRIVTGMVSELRADGDFGRADCLGTVVAETDDARSDPPSGDGFYYLAQGLDACAGRGYGAAHGVTPDPRADLEVGGPCP